MAGKQVQRRRGSTVEHSVFTGAMGEVTVDTTKFVQVVHNGATPGGFPQASARDIADLADQAADDDAVLQSHIDANLLITVQRDSATGAAHIPKGGTAQRPAGPQDGDMRYNTDLLRFEGFTNGVWGAIGAGATGGGNDRVFVENDQIITTNYTITAGRNAMSAGTVSIANGVTVTVPSGSTWSIV